MVNITEFQAPPVPDTWAEILRMIFTRQGELIEKYREIEQLPAPPISLHHASGQRILKDFAWRTTEELTESYEARIKHSDEEVAREHALEEMADALHFLVELLIYAGITADMVLSSGMMTWPDIEKAKSTAWFWNATYQLGIAMNFLRNKAWKQAQVPTDEARFRVALQSAFHAHVELWASEGLTQEDMFNFYFRKSEVNKFRQRSQY